MTKPAFSIPHPSYEQLTPLQQCYVDEYARQTIATSPMQRQNFMVRPDAAQQQALLRELVLTVVGIDALTDALNDVKHPQHHVVFDCTVVEKMRNHATGHSR